jgi:oxygen-independent coproporphyrinogen-3 oxidase
MQPASHHLYVHVPFCRLVCAYCDFVTVGGRADDIPRYVDALVEELDRRPKPGELRTVYFGGGTPSLLRGDQISRVIQAATTGWGVGSVTEITVEANPSGRETPDWAGMRAAGVNRLSLGVQSLRDAELVALARGHTAAEARTAYAEARRAGFDNVSIDLIYGLPEQSMADWREGLTAAIDLGPDHISCYALQLALEPDEWAAPPRPGALRWRERVAPRQDEGVAADQYALAEDMLDAAGFEHYELSSWARPGRESMHNQAYWSRRPYTGIGAGAHSYDGTGTRSWNLRDLDAYLAAVEIGDRPLAGSEELGSETRAFEAIALGLRRVTGLDRRTFSTEFGSDPVERWSAVIQPMQQRGLLEVTERAIRLTPLGRLLASEVLVDFAPAPAAVR